MYNGDVNAVWLKHKCGIFKYTFKIKQLIN